MLPTVNVSGGISFNVFFKIYISKIFDGSSSYEKNLAFAYYLVSS
jgi:hypothetical protein